MRWLRRRRRGGDWRWSRCGTLRTYSQETDPSTLESSLRFFPPLRQSLPHRSSQLHPRPLLQHFRQNQQHRFQRRYRLPSFQPSRGTAIVSRHYCSERGIINPFLPSPAFPIPPLLSFPSHQHASQTPPRRLQQSLRQSNVHHSLLRQRRISRRPRFRRDRDSSRRRRRGRGEARCLIRSARRDRSFIQHCIRSKFVAMSCSSHLSRTSLSQYTGREHEKRATTCIMQNRTMRRMKVSTTTYNFPPSRFALGSIRIPSNFSFTSFNTFVVGFQICDLVSAK